MQPVRLGLQDNFLLQSSRMPTVIHSSALFSRNLRKPYPIALRGEGSWIVATDGRRFLDASGQAAVISIGHGVTEIGRAMAAQSDQIAFAHTTQFHSEQAEKLAARVLATEVGTSYPLEEIKSAVKQAEMPGRTGKVLLRM